MPKNDTPTAASSHPLKGKSHKQLELKGEGRRERVANLFSQGVTMTEIARIEGVSVSVISKDVKRLRRIWQRRYAEKIEETVQQEIGRLDYLYKRLWVWVESSCKPLGRNTPAMMERPPDPRLIARLQKCIELKLKALGVFDDSNKAPNTINVFGDILAEISSGNVDEFRAEFDPVERLIEEVGKR